MTNIDPFRRYNPITDDNVLKIKVISLKSEQLQNDFNTGIDLLSDVRDTLTTIQNIGRINELGQLPYYIDAMRWLHLESPLANFIGVPQISNYSDIDASIANQFKQYVEAFRSQLRNNPIYTAVEASRAAFHHTISRQAQAQIEKLEDDAEATLLASSQAAANNLAQQVGSLTSGINDASVQAQNTLQQLLSSASETIKTETNVSTSSIRTAQSLERWGESYDASIEEYRLRLFGKQWGNSTIKRNYDSWHKLRLEELAKHEIRAAKIYYVSNTTMIVAIKNLLNATTFLLSKTRTYRGKRSIWFTALALFAILFFLMSIVEILGLKNIFGHDISKNIPGPNQPWYARYTLYLPIALILGIAYSFSIKNYRIYSNMLDQYEHRRTVAYTAQGIILSLKDTQDQGLRDEVTTAAAKALFEHKNTGHLTKSESESLNVLDLLKTTRSH